MAKYGKSSKSGFKTGTNSSGYQTFNTGSGWKSTHRAVAEKKVGGTIFKGCEVHHINGNKTDNRSSNLTILSKAAHRKIHGK